MRNKQLLVLLPVLFCAQVLAAQPAIVFAASTDNAMPLAEFHNNALDSGILKELGEAIGHELHLATLFISLPRNRLEAALISGEVDGACYIRPEWVEAQLNWSQPLIPNENLLATNPTLPQTMALKDVSGKTLGLVVGYKYPELDAALGSNYRRDDAPDMLHVIKKLLIGRELYAVVDRLSFEYQITKYPQLKQFSTLTISTFHTPCGFSLASKIPFTEIDNAINKLILDGTIDHILTRYRQ
ncbi:substrate-binding periplasmic protein [Solimicrobium silvestre]|uniref:Bacterial extracellular solute-binding protein, family 3 n=1 Tax=Solimicrobium silvestre TaxID=2099400 RepID=A0A2S9H2Q6_9BURK|nr:transporter substrate-binding domain-containing protein [Solimicrobium silvestre]PRC94223.1 Bacterial extracellular solute-binding protein, family 3 [Solimicrobium silvestre]